MSTTLSFAFLTSTMLAWVSPDSGASSHSTADVPATCLATTGPKVDAGSSWWHDVLPVLVAGLDYRPRRRARSRFETPLATSDSVAAGDRTSRQNHRDRVTTRWTLSLRWRTSRDSPPEISTSEPVRGVSGLCRQYLDALARTPHDLAEAVDHWADTARMRAVLDYRHRTREARDE